MLLENKLERFIWFTKNSYFFIVNKSFKSKVLFITGFIPAWIKFNKGDSYKKL